MMSTGASGSLGEINLLSGGLMQANSIAPGSATGTSLVNFNGGTLKANTANTTFITTNNTAVNVYGKGGTINNNGVNLTIPIILAAPAGNGLNASPSVTSGGSGYLGAPAVTFTGGGGVGASGYATISGGAVNGMVITSPGTGYSSAPTITLTGGGCTTAATATAPAPTANTSGGMTFQGSGTTTLSGANNYTGGTTNNAGTLLVNGSIGSGAVTVAGGTLGGNGAIGGAVTVQSGGSLAPGGGLTTLTVNGGVTLQSGSTTFLEISKSSHTNDQLVAGGALNYGGTLVVTNLGGTLAAGDSFKLFRAGSFNGTFASNSLPTLNAGLGWSTAALGGGILNVIQATPTNLVWSVSGTNLTLSWPADHTGWRLLMQTNHLVNGISSNTNDWGTVANSQQTNQIALPVNPTSSSEFYRLVYP
jgi:autotransporter-associated beta strand protein